MERNNSKKIYEEAIKVLPGGVNSPVRAFKSVESSPIFIKSADGCYLTDEDNNKYLDFISSWGPMILGHNNPLLTKCLQDNISLGSSYGLPTKVEVELAELMIDAYPGLEMVRMVNSGTEATMSAIRVARGVTNRKKIIKFEGNYHGHNDSLLVKSGSGTLTYGVPTSPGVLEEVISETLVCTYNDLNSVRSTVEKYPEDIACIIVEPIAGNMGLVPGKKAFLQGLRDICDQYGIILIFDEVISGFRASYAGASGIYDIVPDMACFGKIIGGGLPVGAYGGSQKIMNQVSPVGPIYQAGTLSGNPLAMHAGKTMLEYLKDDKNKVYENLETLGAYLEKTMDEILNEYNVNHVINRRGSLMTMFFTDLKEVSTFDDVQKSNFDLYTKYFNKMLEKGILLPPSQYECMFLNTAMQKEDIEKFINAFKETMEELFKC